MTSRYENAYVTLVCGHKRRVRVRPKDWETTYTCLSGPGCGHGLNWVRYADKDGRAGSSNPRYVVGGTRTVEPKEVVERDE